MIDLKKLEAKIDSLLESETTESLTNWLMNKRNQELNELLGDGSFINFASCNTIIYPESSTVFDSNENSTAVLSNTYPIAA